uniref:Uncharacterized protein n=1 Tax=Cuerna arida TaxID=1464854 RepID=A0A1B6EQ97_9HEMI
MAESRPHSSLETSKASIPSNEELIDSLVSGLEKSFVNDESENNSNVSNTLKEDSACKDSENECNNVASSENKVVEPELKQGDDILGEALSDKDLNIPSLEDDLVDELALKDLELTYSEEDRERLYKEAVVFKQTGNDLFKSAQYRESAHAYTQALRTCPLKYAKDRAIFYSNRAAAKMKLELNESAIEDCTKALELDERYLKALYRRAQLYEATDKLDEALVDYNEVLKIDPLHKDAMYASKRLPDQIQERNEKLKTEMLGKLKDLGNLFLKPFGLSTENFQLSQDPNSGGYSVNFKS